MACFQSPTGKPGTGDAPPANRTGPAANEAARPVRLLLADGDARVRAAVHETIALEADLVLVADTGDAAEALALAERVDPSVALVDLHLPDGATGLALVRSLSRRPHCAVVAMSEPGSLRDAALAAGAVAAVDKSGDIDAVLSAVRAAARSLHPDRATSPADCRAL